MKRLLNQLLPFLILGIALVTLVFGIVLLSYILFFGIVAGTILYIFNWVREKYFLRKSKKKTKKSSGRVIDSDDWKILP